MVKKKVKKIADEEYIRSEIEVIRKRLLELTTLVVHVEEIITGSGK